MKEPTLYEKYVALKHEGENATNTPAGFIYIGVGNRTESLNNFWGRNVTTLSGRVGRGISPDNKYFVKRKIWFSKMFDEMFDHSAKCIIGRIRTKMQKGEMTPAQAVAELKNRVNVDFVVPADAPSSLVLKEACFVNPPNGAFYTTNEDFKSVIIGTNDVRSNPLLPRFKTQDWHSSSIDENSFKCGHTHKFYASSVFHKVDVEGLPVCAEAVEGSIFEWEDGTFHWEKENDNVAEYHSVTRRWNNEEVKEKIGIELEIYAKQRGKLNRSLPRAEIFGETDGSLSRDYGIELVGKPYTFDEYVTGKTKWNEVIQKAASLGSVGYDPPDDRQYGMHVSLSRNMFKTSFHLAKFVVFFNMQDELCKVVAQRDTIYSGQYKVRKKIVNANRGRDNNHPVLFVDTNYGKRDARRYVVDTNKYEAVSVGEKRVECRIFRSNLSWERFMKNIEFCMAVKEFTAFASARDVAESGKGTVKFVEWLFNQGQYVNLKKFLMNQSAIINGTSVSAPIARLKEKAKNKKNPEKVVVNI